MVSQVLLCYWLICSIIIFKLKWFQLLSYWGQGWGVPEALKNISWLCLHFFKSSLNQSFCSIEFFIITLLITPCLCCPSPPHDTILGTARFLYTPKHHWSKAALGLISDSWEKYFIKLLSQIHCPDSQSTIVSFPLIESRLRCSFLSPESLYIEGSRKVGIYFSFEINMPPQCP